jgi:hypothetical protein
MQKHVILSSILTILVTTHLIAQQDLLIKIPQNSNRQIRSPAMRDFSLRNRQGRYGIKLRYRTQEFAIAQADPRAFAELPEAQILDTITPDFNYYILWFDSARGRAKIEGYGTILDQFGGFALLKLHADLEPILFSFPVHHRAKLPAEIPFPEYYPPAFAPSIPASPQQREFIRDLLNQADGDRWFRQIITLVENEDLRRPGEFFQSRYALRVRDAVQLDGRPRPDHACDNSADYIADQFRSYGLEVEFDPFNHRRREVLGGLVGEYVMRNVIATLPGKGPNKNRIYLMTGHYDSIASKTPGWDVDWRRLPAPGASDNASGIAEILETARILSQHDFDFTIRFIAFSGEELFLFGSKHYAERVEQRGDEIMGVLNFDLLGHDEDGILDIHVLGDEQSQWLVNAFGTAAKRYNIPVDLRLKNDPSFIFSDHSPFWEIGVPAVMVAEEASLEAPEESTAYIHSHEDTLAKISRPLLGELSIKLAVATLAELARPIANPTEVTQVQPDIFWEPGGIGISNPAPVKGEALTLSASVKNAGPTAVADIAIQFVAVRPDGGSEVIAEQTLALGVGQSQKVSADFTPPTVGVFTLRVITNNDARIFEADFGNNRIETALIVTDGDVTIENIAAYPNPINFNQARAALKITYMLGRDADVAVAIYDALGEQIIKREFRAGDNGGRLGENDAFTWDGTNENRENVAPGVYVCQITATDVDGESETEGTKVAVIR